MRSSVYVALPLLIALTISAVAVEGTATLSGTAEVVDGDTLDLVTGSTRSRLRLFGIDAPEGGQTCLDDRGRPWACGGSARRALEDLTRDRVVACQGQGLDAYGRLLAICTTDRGGREVNAALVRQGLAWAFVRYSTAYVSTEQEARNARRGLFATQNTPPWEYRAERWKEATGTAVIGRAPARSRATSHARVSASIICHGRQPMNGRRSMSVLASAGSATRVRRSGRGGEGRGDRHPVR